MQIEPTAGRELEGFSEEERGLLETLDVELHRTIETLKVERRRNAQHLRQRVVMEGRVRQAEEKVELMGREREEETQKLRKVYQKRIRAILMEKTNQKSPKKPPNCSLNTSSPHNQSKQQQKPVRSPFAKSLRLILLQEFLHFFASLFLTHLPHRSKPFKRLLPMTFLLLRIGVFVLVSQIDKVLGCLRAFARREHWKAGWGKGYRRWWGEIGERGKEESGAE